MLSSSDPVLPSPRRGAVMIEWRSRSIAAPQAMIGVLHRSVDFPSCYGLDELAAARGHGSTLRRHELEAVPLRSQGERSRPRLLVWPMGLQGKRSCPLRRVDNASHVDDACWKAFHGLAGQTLATKVPGVAHRFAGQALAPAAASGQRIGWRRCQMSNCSHASW